MQSVLNNTAHFWGSFNKDKFIEFYLHKFSAKKYMNNFDKDFKYFLLSEIELLLFKSRKFK